MVFLWFSYGFCWPTIPVSAPWWHPQVQASPWTICRLLTMKKRGPGGKERSDGVGQVMCYDGPCGEVLTKTGSKDRILSIRIIQKLGQYFYNMFCFVYNMFLERIQYSQHLVLASGEQILRAQITCGSNIPTMCSSVTTQNGGSDHIWLSIWILMILYDILWRGRSSTLASESLGDVSCNDWLIS